MGTAHTRYRRCLGPKYLPLARWRSVLRRFTSRGQDAPDQGFWLTLDAGGAGLPSDRWYLRLAGEITRMFHGEIGPDPKMPADPGKK